MGNLINKTTVIDSETGEIMKERQWIGYDGFNDKGYKYRRNATFIRYYFDSLPDNLSENAWQLLLMISEIMNDENVLIYKVKRKSKFSDIVYKPMDKDDIAERIRFKYGQNKFDSAFKELCKHCLKKVEYHDLKNVWAVNPAVISKCKQVPFWLYMEFQEYMNPFLTATALKKMQNKIDSFN